MDVRMKLDPARLKSTMNVLSNIGWIGMDDEIVSAMLLWAKLICDMAKKLVPVKSGALRDDINYYLLRRTFAIVQTKATTKPRDDDGRDYAFWLEFGTQPHWVAPKTKKVLSWAEEGKRYYSKGHMVSGIRAVRFMMRAYLATRAQGGELLGAAVRRAIKRKSKR